MSPEPLSFPPFTLDPPNVCLWRGGQRIPLTPKDFAVLHYLATQAGRLVPQQELLRAVWPDTVINSGILKVRLRRIRRALGDKAAQPKFIETVHGLGYRFIASLREGARDLRLETSPAPAQASREVEEEAEGCFLKTIEVARKQQAKSLELRAVMSLSQLWQHQGKQAEARQLLAEVYNWFTEGFDTKDLQEAKALVEELSH